MRSISSCSWAVISSLLLFCFTFTAEAKQKNQEKPDHTLYGMYLDVDIMNPIYHLINHNRMGVNADVQVDLWHKFYPTLVVGYDWFDASSEYSYPVAAHNNLYKVNGLYFKVGALYNIWKKDYSKTLSPTIFLGIYYGMAPKYGFNIENYPISNNYWGQDAASVFNAKGRTTAGWGELNMGVKTPLVKNFCMGFDFSFKLLLRIKDQEIDNKLIHQSYSPGFGDKESGKWGFRYTISYFFPFIKK